MGVDSKAFCKTNTKDALKVLGVVEKAINNYIDFHRDPTVKRFQDQNNKHCSIDLKPWLKMATISFTLKGEKRMMNFHFGCDSDYADTCKGKKLIWSVGVWGESDAVTLVVGIAMEQFGKVYVDLNDCDNIDFAPIETFEVANKIKVQYKMQELFKKPA